MRFTNACLYRVSENKPRAFGQDETVRVKVCDIEVNLTCRSADSYNLNQTDAIKYDMLGITRAKNIKKDMILVANGTEYRVNYCMPSGRFNQLFLEVLSYET